MNTEKYRLWFEYEQDSNAKVLASLQAVADPLRGMPEYQKAIDLLAHLVAARNMWLYRLGVGSAPLELFPAESPLTRLPELLDQMQSAWRTYFESLTDAEVARRFEYTSYDGPRFSNTVDDVLTQLYGHSLYHRGQIAMLLRSIGAEPAPTDFIYWAREAIPNA
ncbi:MAG: DinB family protein [Acidobacteriota bacterium]|nr:DinB family protein [Acidobacteriota bacterium]